MEGQYDYMTDIPGPFSSAVIAEIAPRKLERVFRSRS